MSTAVCISAAGLITAGMASPASAETVTGWTGPALVNGVSYLHNSSITNSPYLFASSSVWTAFGVQMSNDQVGINARLFKSGILCDSTDYVYNGYVTPTFTVSAGAPDCGPGSYNSHGLAKLANGSGGYNSVITFPTNPVNFGPAARSAEESNAAEERTNSSGLRAGSGAEATSEAELPDLIAAFGTDGEIGYVKKTDLASPDLTVEQVSNLPTIDRGNGETVRSSGPRTIPLYDSDGIVAIGTFAIR